MAETAVPVQDDASERGEVLSSTSGKKGPNLSNDNVIKPKAVTTTTTTTTRKVESLAERSKTPNSFYVALLALIMMEGCSGMYKLETLESYWSSVVSAIRTVGQHLIYLRDLTNPVFGERRDTKEYIVAAIATCVVLSLVTIFVVVPFRAGVWTGQRATKHKAHRFMGLAFLIQYALMWIEFLYKVEHNGSLGVLPHAIALNGIIQAYSAYFSFKVLPQLKDAGYYSDRGVLSRTFVHENAFYQLMCAWGSMYYDTHMRNTLQSNLPGRLIEIIFVFFPYVIIRPFFPTTSFSDAGQQSKTRTTRLEKFYQIGTTMIKIFYLWAKYFLGFHINFMVYLGLVKPANLMFVHGLYLLNVGTVSIAVFLHTLRFKKILPPEFTFSFYLCQIYATFSALPYAFDNFVSHPKLCLLSLSGLLCNMTRNKKLQALWCLCCMVLMTFAEIEW